MSTVRTQDYGTIYTALIQHLPVLVAASLSVVPFSLHRTVVRPICRLPHSPARFILGRPSGSTLSTKKMRILMKSRGTLEGAQATPWSLKSPYTAHHLPSMSPGAPSSAPFCLSVVVPPLLPAVFPGYSGWGMWLPVDVLACMAHSLHARLPPTRPPPIEPPNFRAFCSTAD